jgi:hypothetical protein
MPLRLSRRTILRGAAGAAVALPALDAMGGRSANAAGPIPARYFVSYAGISTGASGVERITPAASGRGYQTTPALTPLDEEKVKDQVSVVSGLLVPWGKGTDPNGSDIPPGGRPVQFHYYSAYPQLCGFRNAKNKTLHGPTSDQVVAAAIAGPTVQKSIVLRVQPIRYVGSSATESMSWGRANKRIDPIASPRLAFRSLFGGFVPTAAPAGTQPDLLARRRKSVLDLVREATGSLLPRLGAADRQRLDRHFQEIRALETRLASLPATASSCRPPKDPGEDPALGGSHSLSDKGNVVYTPTAGYSNEELRAQIMTELVYMAFACDISRVASLMYTFTQSFMNMDPLFGHKSDMHQLSHAGARGAEKMVDALRWHVKHFTRLVARLRDTPEVDGSTLLDHSALVLLWEGGHGHDPQTNSENASHSTENMLALIGGRAGGLKPGKHVVAKRKHPTNVVVSAMNAVGVRGGLGEIPDNLPELFS